MNYIQEMNGNNIIETLIVLFIIFTITSYNFSLFCIILLFIVILIFGIKGKLYELLLKNNRKTIRLRLGKR